MTTILLVTTNPVDRRLFSYILRRNQYTVATAHGHQPALNQLAEIPVDLVIVQLHTPALDGMNLLRQMRANVDYHALPVIVFSASGHPEDQQAALAAGADHFLAQPVGSEELLLAVSLLCRQQPPQPCAQPRHMPAARVSVTAAD